MHEESVFVDAATAVVMVAQLDVSAATTFSKNIYWKQQQAQSPTKQQLATVPQNMMWQQEERESYCTARIECTGLDDSRQAGAGMRVEVVWENGGEKDSSLQPQLLFIAS